MSWPVPSGSTREEPSENYIVLEHKSGDKVYILKKPNGNLDFYASPNTFVMGLVPMTTSQLAGVTK